MLYNGLRLLTSVELRFVLFLQANSATYRHIKYEEHLLLGI